jgi:ATP-dependent helicase HrpA
VETSDFLGYLKLWDWYHSQARHLSQNKLRKLCQENFLSYVRLREWNEVHQQLHSLVTEMGLHHRGGGAAPSPGTPGEGRGGGLPYQRRVRGRENGPHPSPPPEYRERG